MAELSAGLNLTSQRITAAVAAFGHAASQSQSETVKMSSMHWKRSELNGLQDGYTKCSDTTLHDL